MRARIERRCKNTLRLLVLVAENKPEALLLRSWRNKVAVWFGSSRGEQFGKDTFTDTLELRFISKEETTKQYREVMLREVKDKFLEKFKFPDRFYEKNDLETILKTIFDELEKEAER
jgi:hypothetical protein